MSRKKILPWVLSLAVILTSTVPSVMNADKSYAAETGDFFTWTDEIAEFSYDDTWFFVLNNLPAEWKFELIPKKSIDNPDNYLRFILSGEDADKFRVVCDGTSYWTEGAFSFHLELSDDSVELPPGEYCAELSILEDPAGEQAFDFRTPQWTIPIHLIVESSGDSGWGEEYGWDDSHTHYYYGGGEYATGFNWIWDDLARDYKYYHFNEDDGKLDIGWFEIHDQYEDEETGEILAYTDKYFADSTGIIQTGWRKINENWYYFAQDSGVLNRGGIQYIGGKTYYLDPESGRMRVGWICEINEFDDGTSFTEWYYADSNGVIKEGWQKISGFWYYLGEGGIMASNEWMKDSRGWCWLQADGKMLTNGWAKDSKGWCWIGANGYMVENTQWVKCNDDWYHITKGYRDQNKWMKDSKGWCWLEADGKMLTNGWVKDSKGWCWIGANGYMVEKTQWVKCNGDWYHITKGYRDQNKWMKDSKGWCWLEADGKMLTNGWAKDSKGMCWIGKDGYMVEETKLIDYDGDTYGIENGYMVVGRTITIDGNDYTFDENGKLI